MTSTKKDFDIIVAMDQNRGIGKNNDIPWKLSRDLKYFKQITCATKDPKKQNAVIMGRKTWESIPPKFRPLPDRLNVVLSRTESYHFDEEEADSCCHYQDFETALSEVSQNDEIESIFVIGGGKIYEEAIAHPNCKRLYITELSKAFDCDTHFPQIPKYFKRVYHSNFYVTDRFSYAFTRYDLV